MSWVIGLPTINSTTLIIRVARCVERDLVGGRKRGASTSQKQITFIVTIAGLVCARITGFWQPLG